jgi:hypothetical protein
MAAPDPEAYLTTTADGWRSPLGHSPIPHIRETKETTMSLDFPADPPARRRAAVHLVGGASNTFTFLQVEQGTTMIKFTGVGALPDDPNVNDEGFVPADEIWYPVAAVKVIAIAPYAEEM